MSLFRSQHSSTPEDQVSTGAALSHRSRWRYLLGRKQNQNAHLSSTIAGHSVPQERDGRYKSRDCKHLDDGCRCVSVRAAPASSVTPTRFIRFAKSAKNNQPDFSVERNTRRSRGTSRYHRSGGVSLVHLRLVISLDFGTTYSGASYALVHPNDRPEDVKVVPISNWVGELPGDTDSKKVPTQIAYDKDNLGQQYWGFDIPESLRERTLRWFKLLLEPERSDVVKSFADVIDPSFTETQLQSYGLDVVTVASDYVRLLWQHVVQQIIIQTDQATFDRADKSVVLTIPAVWSESAKHNMYLVAVNAGLANEAFELRIVPEPEAAAAAVLKDKIHHICKDDVYIVVDAGGGTVDLATYTVKATEPLVLEELTPGSGDICGAAFITFNFRKLLRTYLGEETMSSLRNEEPESEARIIRDFEDGVRKKFDGTDTRKMSVAITGVSENRAHNIRGGLMRLTAAELNPVFLPVLEKVERLVRRQVMALKRIEKRPKAILLVGGFGANHYLYKRLQAIYCNKENNVWNGQTISVSQPSNGWQSIANGAILCKIFGFGSMVSLRMARYNIGVVYDQDFDPERHRQEQMTTSAYDGKVIACNVVFWYLRRGDSLRAGHMVNFPTSSLVWERDVVAWRRHALRKGTTCKIPLKVRLVSSQEDDASDFYDAKHVREFVSLVIYWDLSIVSSEEIPLNSSPAGQTYREISWTIHMKQGLGGLHFTYSSMGRSFGPAHVTFHNLASANKDAQTGEVPPLD